MFEILFFTRLGFTKAVVSSFGTLMAAHRGEVVCVVTTAKVFTHSKKWCCSSSSDLCRSLMQPTRRRLREPLVDSLSQERRLSSPMLLTLLLLVAWW